MASEPARQLRSHVPINGTTLFGVVEPLSEQDRLRYLRRKEQKQREKESMAEATGPKKKKAKRARAEKVSIIPRLPHRYTTEKTWTTSS